MEAGQKAPARRRDCLHPVDIARSRKRDQAEGRAMVKRSGPQASGEGAGAGPFGGRSWKITYPASRGFFRVSPCRLPRWEGCAIVFRWGCRRARGAWESCTSPSPSAIRPSPPAPGRGRSWSIPARSIPLCRGPHLEAIGLKPKGWRVYETADGREVEMDVTTGDIEVMGEITAGLIIVGDADAEPLLGVMTLESVGIEVDPQNQRLKKLPAVRLKGVACRFDRPSRR